MPGYIHFASLVCMFLLLGGCATLEVSTQVQSGRKALKLNQPKTALAHFEAAAAQDPNYTTRFTLLTTGIWTYVGKSYYALGEKDKALASFKRAKESASNDYVGRIYLGLVMAQTGNTSGGKSELLAGLNGLGSWLEGLPGTGERGQVWDPERRIANGISQTRSMLQTERPDGGAITANVEWLGRRLEAEIEEAKDDLQNLRQGTGGDDE